VLTEIPEHLLQRSRERRAALGLGGGDDAGAAPAPAADAGSGTEVTPAASAAPAPAAAVEPEPKAPEPVPHYVEAAKRRQRIPVWAVPVLAGLIFWAPIYIGTLQEPVETGGPLAAGGEVYQTCSGCHGPAGGGGVGRQLSDGEVLLTFPAWEDHANFVLVGNPASEVPDGTPYGDPNRPGGPHLSGETGSRMPGFANSLSTLEILEVTLYERVTHGGADMESDDIVSLLEAIEAVQGGDELDLTSLSPGAATDDPPDDAAPSDADSQ
jgi:mono/diheme cytochrome c family protein